MNHAAFIITHYCVDEIRASFLARTIESIQAQTDPSWVTVIANDCSPWPDTRQCLEAWRARDSRIHLVENLVHAGPGAGRNKAVRMAAALGASIVLHQDDDDLAHPRRVSVTRSVFRDRPSIGLAYSGFTPIDDEDQEIPRVDVRLDMLEVLEELDRGALEGTDVFTRMTAETGFIATLSTVAVPIATALVFPFTSGRASDDSHAWMRIAATGAEFVFIPEIPARYRIVGTGPSDLGVNGRDQAFLHEKVHNDIDGFEQGIAILIRRGVLTNSDLPSLSARFLHRLAACIERQGEYRLAGRLRSPSTIDALAARLSFEELLRPDITRTPSGAAQSW